MIRVTPFISLDDSEITLEFLRASGPGGQNVQKVETAVRLRFDARRSPSLPEGVRARLERLAGGRLTKDGVVIIEATIGPNGAVQEAKVLRSIPLLDAAALDAVRQWTFTPTTLNGVPVPVIMTVTVNFTLQ